jgi:hypothetical protein
VGTLVLGLSLILAAASHPELGDLCWMVTPGVSQASRALFQSLSAFLAFNAFMFWPSIDRY